MAEEILGLERLKELLDYNPESGAFTRRKRTAQCHQVGDRADFIVSSGQLKGYRRVALLGKRYLAHRLAWFYVNGLWPAEQIDHRNGDKADNHIANLRSVTNQVNAENLRVVRRSKRSSELLGVFFHAQSGRWRARLTVNRKGVHIGMFDTPEEAHQAYIEAKRIHHDGCTI